MINNKEWMNEGLGAILSTTAKSLAAKRHVRALSILVNAEASLSYRDHDNWDGGQDYWSLDLAIPVEVYYALEDVDTIKTDIDAALSVVMKAISDRDFLTCWIQTRLEDDPDWRIKGRQFLSGEGINNQGRVRSENIAAREHDGLLFRSRPEVYFYNALKSAGVPFAPLAVVVKGGLTYHRVEPDFLIFTDGITMIVEIDGDMYHSETPAAAHARLKFLTDENARLERIPASSCDTPEKARQAVALIVSTIDKLRRATS
jgi:hypothetical protein